MEKTEFVEKQEELERLTEELKLYKTKRNFYINRNDLLKE